jgi:Na+-translocating ferredoxin:NAD+ oxidoreductase RnfD subunit
MHDMDISFDPFIFGVTTLALIIAAIELYYTRPRRIHQVSTSILIGTFFMACLTYHRSRPEQSCNKGEDRDRSPR